MSGLKITCICLLLLVFSLDTRAKESETNGIVAKNAPINGSIIYGIPHWPPFTIVEKNTFSGRDVELINLLAAKTGISIQYSPCEWVRCLELTKTGKVDLLTSVSHSTEREAFLHYVHPAYSAGSIVFWVKKGQADLINDINELLFLTIGKEKGAKLYKAVDENPQIEIYESPDFTILIKMLASGRIDTIMGSELATHHLVRSSDYANRLELANFKHKVPSSYLALSRNSKNANKWLPEFEKHMQDMMLNGELEYFLNWQESDKSSKH